MSEGSSRSSQEGLDGLHGDGRQQMTLHRTKTAPSAAECPRTHPPVTRVCTSPHMTSHLYSTHRASGLTATPRPHGGGNSADAPGGGLNDSRFPPPYNAHHRLAGSPPAPTQQPPLQHGRLTVAQSVAPDSQMGPQSPEWQDWQRDRWQIWQLLSSDNADTLPETLV